MGRSRLPPLPSLLGLLGALLMLPPELLAMDANEFYDALVNQPYVQKALASAVEQYNQNRKDSANYFKAMRVPKARVRMIRPIQYTLLVELVKTTCKKKIGKIKKYKEIQKCKPLQGNEERPNCYFAVRAGHMQFKMNLEITACL